MDLEPGRCRRTDGKKWRCRLAVLPDQKYCERHIHRGCVRSRKPVEDHKTFFMSKPTATITVSPLKAAINATKSVCIKKRSREDACGNLEFSFTPKSVLQNGNVQHSSTSSNNHKNKHSVTESERCRRTDGKKWQCTKSALQGQKYCAQHMHRGAKKVQNRQHFNTGLSFSVGVGYQQKGDIGNQPNESSSSDDDDDDGNNSSSSDATTISM